MDASWRNIGLITRREYRFRTRQRAFVILTIILAVVLVLLASAPTIIEAIRGGGDRTITIAVTDTSAPAATGDAIATLDARLRANGAGDTIALIATSAALETLRAQVNSGTLRGILMMSRDAGGDLIFAYETKDGTRDATTTRIQQAAAELAVVDRLQRAGVNTAQVFAPAPFAVRATQPQTATRSESERFTSRSIAYVLAILLYTSIIVYGMWVAGGVVEEKSNRVMEIMITAATPTELMAGKILGIGAAALTQYLCITIPAAVALALQGPLAQALFGGRRGTSGLDLTSISLAAAAAFVGFFILNFLLYAALYAAVGSLVSRQEEVQQISGPMNFLMIGSFFAATFALGAPDSTVARVFGFVPFTAPIVMLVRVIVGTPAAWEVALAVAILLVSIALAVALAARVYRIGVLLYGTRPTLRTVFKLSGARTAR